MLPRRYASVMMFAPLGEEAPTLAVIPAQAGTQTRRSGQGVSRQRLWISGFAGMTDSATGERVSPAGIDQVVPPQCMAQLIVGKTERIRSGALVEAVLRQRAGEQLALEPCDARLEVRRAGVAGGDRAILRIGT